MRTQSSCFLLINLLYRFCSTPVNASNVVPAFLREDADYLDGMNMLPMLTRVQKRNILPSVTPADHGKVSPMNVRNMPMRNLKRRYSMLRITKIELKATAIAQKLYNSDPRKF